MASINTRTLSDGSFVYRLRFRFKGYEPFTLTFDDEDACHEWAKHHEEKFINDPQSYFDWKKSFIYESRRHRQIEDHHIVRPKIRRVK